MRKLMLFTIGFTVACAVGAYLVTGMWLLFFGVIMFAGMVGACFIKNMAGKKSAVVLLGAAIGFLWIFLFDTFYLTPARNLDTQEIEVSVEITDYSHSTDYGIAADGKIKLNGNIYKVKAYLYRDVQLKPGDRVEGHLRLRYTAAGGTDEVTYHQGKGIFLLGYFDDDAQIYSVANSPKKYFPAIWRRSITDILDHIFPEDVLGFARALLLGDSSLLSYEHSSQLSVSGIRHIIAVSGLHVSILYGVMYVLMGYRRGFTELVLFSMLALFAALAGFTPSVVRACIMQALMLLSMTVRKEYDGPTALSFSVFVMLAVNPLVITSVSLQLSAGCMIGIIAFSGKISGFLLHKTKLGPAKGKSIKARLTRSVVGSVSVTLSAMVVTTPLSALYFGTVSLIGIVTNLLTLSVVTVLFCGIIAACVAGAIWIPLGRGIAWGISWLARYVLFVSKLMASFPLAAVYTKSVYVVIWLVMSYVLIGVFLLLKRKRPWMLAGCLITGLLVAVGLSWLEPRLNDYRMTVLDVGQGQCILIQAEDKYYVVDCGGDSSLNAADTAIHTLLSQGITRLDGMILTHYDLDHAGGVSYLLSRIPADQLYLPDVVDNEDVRQSLAENYADCIRWIAPEQTVTLEAGNITLFTGKAGVTDRESGLCILFQTGNCDILITGDRSAVGERALLDQTDLPDLEILVVGHHGAKDSTCLELLRETMPEIAIISVGRGNNYGHPTDAVLDRLERFGCQILRTDILGDIIIKG